jgi:hypothetical protein
MYRSCFFALAFMIFLSGTFGCGNSGPKQEKKDPFKARREAAPAKNKDKKQDGGDFMRP